MLHSRETNQYTLFSQENTGQPELKAIKREEGYLKYRIKNCEGELFIPYYHNDNVEPDAVLTTFQPIIDDQPLESSNKCNRPPSVDLKRG